MKKYMIALFLIVSICNAQQSKSYLELTNSLKPMDTTEFVENYKNGNRKSEGKYLVYYTGQYASIEFAFGKFNKYYKDGNIMEEIIYDSFGYEINYKLYDNVGDLTYERETLILDTSAENLNEFLFSEKHIIYTDYVKQYKYSIKLCKQYLYSEGRLYNGKKKDIWITYKPDGTIKKEKNYKSSL